MYTHLTFHALYCWTFIHCICTTCCDNTCLSSAITPYPPTTLSLPHCGCSSTRQHTALFHILLLFCHMEDIACCSPLSACHIPRILCHSYPFNASFNSLYTCLSSFSLFSSCTRMPPYTFLPTASLPCSASHWEGLPTSCHPPTTCPWYCHLLTSAHHLSRFLGLTSFHCHLLTHCLPSYPHGFLPSPCTSLPLTFYRSAWFATVLPLWLDGDQYLLALPHISISLTPHLTLYLPANLFS